MKILVIINCIFHQVLHGIINSWDCVRIEDNSCIIIYFSSYFVFERYYSSLRIGVDSSSQAIDIAKENIVLNNLDSGIISFVKDDATLFMKTAIAEGNSWDIVILDPPKLAPSRKVN